MFLKTRYLLEQAGGRVVFATGTPISNTMAEMYTMLRYFGPGLLQQRGVEHFDAWAGNFAGAVTALELAPDGSGYRMHTRFAKFINLPELLTMFRTVADVRTADKLKLPRPEIATGRPEIVAAPASEPLKAFVKTLTDRAERLRSQRIDPSQDNILKITGDGRKAALDMRLVEEFAVPHGDTKLSRAVDRGYNRPWLSTSANIAVVRRPGASSLMLRAPHLRTDGKSKSQVSLPRPRLSGLKPSEGFPSRRSVNSKKPGCQMFRFLRPLHNCCGISLRNMRKGNWRGKPLSVIREQAAYLRPDLLAMRLPDIKLLHLSKEWSRLLESGGHFRKSKQPRAPSAKTVRNVAGVVSGAFARAIRWGLAKLANRPIFAYSSGRRFW